MINLLKSVTLLTLLLLAGCSNVDDNHHHHSHDYEPEGLYQEDYSSFYYYLYEGYLGLAKQEDNENDVDDFELFSDKAQRVKDGRIVDPQHLNMRRLPEKNVQELREARQRLLTAFYQGSKEKLPKESAYAQVMFDCWMQEQEENFQQHDIDVCKNQFYDALALLSPAPLTPEPEIIANNAADQHCACDESPALPAEPNKAPVAPPVFIIYFDFDKDNLTPKAIATINEIKQANETWQPRRIILSGHTDLAGLNTYNEDLSSRRVDNVKNGLILSGISANKIEFNWLGERHPAIKTPDGKRKAENRRVEVHLEL